MIYMSSFQILSFFKMITMELEQFNKANATHLKSASFTSKKGFRIHKDCKQYYEAMLTNNF